jgi:hemolysin activation/secretion protein
MTNNNKILTLALIAAGVVSPVYAQTVAPDSGRLNRELQERPIEAPRTPSVNIELPQAAPETVQPGGLKVTLNEVKFTGNTVFDHARLAGELQPMLGKPYDLAGFYDLAQRVSEFYRSQGYAFAKVFVPKDGYRDGVLTLQVVEGSYGERRVQAEDSNHAAAAQRFLNKLEPGSPIEASELERAMLLLEDQPGYDVSPVIKPSVLLGAGDLDVQLNRTPLLSGNVSVSNHGNRYTGYLQARATVFLNSLFQFGDQVSVSALQSDKDLTYGAVQYSMPLGGNGLRGNISYSVTDYELGREFSNLQASGDAEILSAGLSYPWLRTRSSNVSSSLVFQKKEFFDQQLAVNSNVSRSSDSVSVITNFDHLDSFGITYGQLDWTQGDFNGPVPDPARTNGNFTRVNYDIVRQQTLNRRFSLYARLNGQLANDNLDSSESYSLGGPFAVRAYPTGEATGDEGMLGQIELRYRFSEQITPFVFYDIGQVKFENSPTAAGNNDRTLSGAGVGVRYQEGPLALELSVASRGTGGAAQSDPRGGGVTSWLTMRYAF